VSKPLGIRKSVFLEFSNLVLTLAFRLKLKIDFSFLVLAPSKTPLKDLWNPPPTKNYIRNLKPFSNMRISPIPLKIVFSYLTKHRRSAPFEAQPQNL